MVECARSLAGEVPPQPWSPALFSRVQSARYRGRHKHRVVTVGIRAQSLFSGWELFPFTPTLCTPRSEPHGESHLTELGTGATYPCSTGRAAPSQHGFVAIAASGSLSSTVASRRVTAPSPRPPRSLGSTGCWDLEFHGPRCSAVRTASVCAPNASSGLWSKQQRGPCLGRFGLASNFPSSPPTPPPL